MHSFIHASQDNRSKHRVKHITLRHASGRQESRRKFEVLWLILNTSKDTKCARALQKAAVYLMNNTKQNIILLNIAEFIGNNLLRTPPITKPIIRIFMHILLLYLNASRTSHYFMIYKWLCTLFVLLFISINLNTNALPYLPANTNTILLKEKSKINVN